MPFGRPGDVRREVAERIKTVGSDGGLILAPTHHLQLDTPLDNFWALLEAVTGRSWGTRCPKTVAYLSARSRTR